MPPQLSNVLQLLSVPPPFHVHVVLPHAENVPTAKHSATTPASQRGGAQRDVFAERADCFEFMFILRVWIPFKL